jgi:Short C-terminal domain
MQKILFLLVCFVAAGRLSAQTDIVLKGDTLILPNGAKFWLGEEVTLGNGTAPDKSFNFIYEPGRVSVLKRKPLSASYYNKRAVIRKFTRDANYRKSYAYNIVILDFGDRRKYWCDVQGAIDNSELMNPYPTVAAADGGPEAKLARLKKLLDAGAITQEEYETLKSKIVPPDNAAKTTKKPTNAPTVF